MNVTNSAPLWQTQENNLGKLSPTQVQLITHSQYILILLRMFTAAHHLLNSLVVYASVAADHLKPALPACSLHLTTQTTIQALCVLQRTITPAAQEENQCSVHDSRSQT